MIHRDGVSMRPPQQNPGTRWTISIHSWVWKNECWTRPLLILSSPVTLFFFRASKAVNPPVHSADVHHHVIVDVCARLSLCSPYRAPGDKDSRKAVNIPTNPLGRKADRPWSLPSGRQGGDDQESP